MRNQLSETLRNLKENEENGFIPYIMAGDGGLQKLPETIRYLEGVGATAIEIGIPFSDPVADGPSIQEAGLRALAEGVNLRSILHVLSEHDFSVPLIIMTYANPVLQMGPKAFAEAARRAGVSACIIPDVPLEEEALFKEPLRGEGIVLIRLVPLTASLERLEDLSNEAEGFLYAVTVNGITGEKAELEYRYLQERVEYLKGLTKVPIYAGFGISNPKTANALLAFCDGIIVGSKIVNALHKKELEEIDAFVKGVKRSSEAPFVF